MVVYTINPSLGEGMQRLEDTWSLVASQGSQLCELQVKPVEWYPSLFSGPHMYVHTCTVLGMPAWMHIRTNFVYMYVPLYVHVWVHLYIPMASLYMHACFCMYMCVLCYNSNKNRPPTWELGAGEGFVEGYLGGAIGKKVIWLFQLKYI